MQCLHPARPSPFRPIMHVVHESQKLKNLWKIITTVYGYDTSTSVDDRTRTPSLAFHVYEGELRLRPCVTATCPRAAGAQPTSCERAKNHPLLRFRRPPPRPRPTALIRLRRPRAGHGLLLVSARSSPFSHTSQKNPSFFFFLFTLYLLGPWIFSIRSAVLFVEALGIEISE